MRRNAINELVKWKNDEERKPLVLRGARQDAIKDSRN